MTERRWVCRTTGGATLYYTVRDVLGTRRAEPFDSNKPLRRNQEVYVQWLKTVKRLE